MVLPWPPRPLPIPPIDLHDAFVLRPPVQTDAAAYAAAWADPEICRWLDPPQADEQTARRWIAGESGRRSDAVALDLPLPLEPLLFQEARHAGPARFLRRRRQDQPVAALLRADQLLHG